MNLGCVRQHDNAVQIGVIQWMKRLAVSDIHILPSVWRKGDDMMSIMSQTAFQVALVCVGAGRPTGKVQQPRTEKAGLADPSTRLHLGKSWLFKIRRFRIAISNGGSKDPSGNVPRHILSAVLQIVPKIQEGNSSR
jgi:hypothetical protein